MSRLISLLILFALAVAPALSTANAVCRHQSLAEHIVDSDSSDARTANVARGEETAASLSRKGTLASSASAPLLAVLAPVPALPRPSDIRWNGKMRAHAEIAPTEAYVRPLLKPPAV